MGQSQKQVLLLGCIYFRNALAPRALCGIKTYEIFFPFFFPVIPSIGKKRKKRKRK
jgi:hypothetical protein